MRFTLGVARALAGDDQRAVLEAAHARAVAAAVGYLRDTVPVTTQRTDGANAPDRTTHLLAAEFRHTTAHGVAGRALIRSCTSMC